MALSNREKSLLAALNELEVMNYTGGLTMYTNEERQTVYNKIEQIVDDDVNTIYKTVTKYFYPEKVSYYVLNGETAEIPQSAFHFCNFWMAWTKHVRKLPMPDVLQSYHSYLCRKFPNVMAFQYPQK